MSPRRPRPSPKLRRLLGMAVSHLRLQPGAPQPQTRPLVHHHTCQVQNHRRQEALPAGWQYVVALSGQQRAAMHFYSKRYGITFFFLLLVVWDYSLRKTYSVNEHRLLVFPLPGNRSAIWELDVLWNTNPIISIRLPAVDHQSVCGLLLVALTHCGAQQRVFKKGGTQSAFSSSLLFTGLAHTLALERVVPAGGSVLWAPCCNNTWSSCFLF